MSIAPSIAEAMSRGSWIRRMFEEGIRLKAEHGAENVFDFSLGNPDLPPPPEFRKVLLEEAAREEPLIHCYMPNGGYPAVRSAVAGHYRERFGLPFGPADIIMTSGAGGALNITLKALLEPGDEVVVLAPFFVEYGFYIANHGGRMVVSETDDRFIPDLEDLEGRLGPRTRALIINSPNNPTGVVYPPELLCALSDLLRAASRRYATTIYLLSDEPYREILFDGLSYPSPLVHYENTIAITSHSKDLSLAGERIGHAAISPRACGRDELSAALTFTNRILGFVNAGALMQRVVARLAGATVDTHRYEQRRDLLCAGLAELGFSFVRPQGAFYLFPQSPLPDDGEFCRLMSRYRVVVVPGSGFCRKGYFRISYAVPEQTIERSLEWFGKAARELGLR